MDTDKTENEDLAQTEVSITPMTSSETKKPIKPEHRSARLKKQPIEEIDYTKFTHQELVEEVKRLNSHVVQLKALFNKSEANEPNEYVGRKHKRSERKFDHERYNKRHVLLKFAYLGWGFHVSDLMQISIFSFFLK